MLDRALALAEATGELQRLGPVASARAEAHWLTGSPDLVAAETERALALATRNADAWAAGELFSGGAGRASARSRRWRVAEPYRLELAGEPEAAARVWAELGCPYDAALARLESDARTSCGSATTSSSGSARVSRPPMPRGFCASAGRATCAEGPRAPTRANPAGLTGRQLEVLGLLAEGLRNGQIADRLVLSPKTVDHHVSGDPAKARRRHAHRGRRGGRPARDRRKIGSPSDVRRQAAP